MSQKQQNDNTQEKHELLLRLPEKLHTILQKYKDTTGLPITNIINEAIVSWCFLKGLISLNEIKDNNHK